MLLHLVIFKYKANVDPAARAQHRERLAGLTRLDGVIELKVGEDVVHAPRSYDTGLAITFTAAVCETTQLCESTEVMV